MSDHDLSLALRALGRRLDTESVADVVPVVLARIAEPEPARRGRVRPLVLAFVVLLLVAATAVAASDRLREWLRGSSVKIERVETLPPTVSTPPTPPRSTASFAALGLGMPVDAAAAEVALGAPLPTSVVLGPPAAIYRAATPDGDAITLAWTPADPVLLTVVPTHDQNDPFLIGKSLTAGTTVEYVSLLAGGEGVYLSGVPHAVTLFDGREVQFRLAEDALLWRPDGDVVHRLEGSFDRARALALVDSFG